MKKYNTKFSKKQIDLHIAEYNALTTRITYLINIQFILLTVGVTWILIAMNLFSSIKNNVVLWIVLFGGQLIGYFASRMSVDIYTIARYIESSLKPDIKEIINHNKFWNWELYLNKGHYGLHRAINDLGVVLFFVIILFLFLFYRLQYWQKWDWFGFSLNLLLLVIYFIKAFSAMIIRSELWDKS
jgi:hypothetical protein